MLPSPPNLSVTTVAEIVRLAVAPVFLLSGIGAFLNVCASRLSRIVDRSRESSRCCLRAAALSTNGGSAN